MIKRSFSNCELEFISSEFEENAGENN